MNRAGQKEAHNARMQREMQTLMDRIAQRPTPEPNIDDLRGIRKFANRGRLKGLMKDAFVRNRLSRLSEECEFFKAEVAKTSAKTVEGAISQMMGGGEAYSLPKLSSAEVQGAVGVMTSVKKEKAEIVDRIFDEIESGQHNAYDHILRASARDPELRRRLLNRFNADQSNGVLERAARVNMAHKVLLADLRVAIRSEGDPKRIMNIVDMIAKNGVSKYAAGRLLAIETNRFALADQLRQNFQSLIRLTTHNPNAVLDDIPSVKQYFETGRGAVPMVYQYGSQAGKQIMTDIDNIIGAAQFVREGVFSFADFILPSEIGFLRDQIDAAKKSQADHHSRINRRREILERYHYLDSGFLHQIRGHLLEAQAVNP